MKKIIYLVLSLILIIGLVGCSDSDSSASVDESLIKDVSYTIEKAEDISIAGAKRYSLDVVVSKEVSVEQLQEISKKVIEDYKKENKFNAIVVGFYDYKEYIGNGYSLGKTEFAPEGDWSKAMEVSTGDYSSMDYNFDLMKKDWSKKLTQDEVTVWKQWNEEYTKVNDELMGKNSTDLPNEDKISQEIAKQNNLTKDQVDEILMKKSTWTFSNEQ
ncbi:DUF4875 domain-containing protein [Tepidibacter mesophilus]|uniref:DUF4875 domain-containing protein n=1 Tax=Tepidibacter mesophilus TaxID=655607 RepID=UPI0011AEC6A8|nr:hypothetical protein [Tepidibacter mesophilus]